MFENRKLRKEQELLKKIEMIQPTSKSELKQSCLMLCNLDVAKAEKMYDFLVKDMPDIPEVPPAQKTFVQNFGEQANGVLGWIRENQDVFSQGWEFVQKIIASRKGAPAITPGQPLPPINQ